MTVVSLQLERDGATVSKTENIALMPNVIAAERYQDADGVTWMAKAVFLDVPVNPADRPAALEAYSVEELLDEVKRRVAEPADYDD